jgi:hypothetical protein
MATILGLLIGIAGLIIFSYHRPTLPEPLPTATVTSPTPEPWALG